MPSRRACEYLAHLQLRGYSRMGRLPPTNRSEIDATIQSMSELFFSEQAKYRQLPEGEFVKMFEQFMEIHPKRHELPTEYESVAFHMKLRDLQKQLQETVVEMEKATVEWPLIGSLPTGSINARVFVVPQSDEYVIGLDWGLFFFTQLLAQAVALATPMVFENHDILLPESPQRIVTEVLRNTEACERFHEVLWAFLVDGDPFKADLYVIPHQMRQTFALSLEESANLFVLAHEYGHVLHGHSRTDGRATAVIGEVAVEESVNVTVEELIADLEGFQIATTCMFHRSRDLTLAPIGPDFFFSCVDIIDRAAGFLFDGQERRRWYESSDNYPSAAYRRHRLREQLARHGDNFAGAIAFARVIERVLDALWTHERDVLSRLTPAQRPLAPAWTDRLRSIPADLDVD